MATWGPTVIQAAADDGCGYGASGWIANELYMGANVGSYSYGAAFRWAVAVAQGSTITSATLTLIEADELGTITNVKMRVYGDDTDNGGAWGTGDVEAQLVASGGKTTAYTTFEPTTWDNGTSRILDVTSIVAEIVARSGWVSGNVMRFGIINNGTTGTGNQAVRTYSQEEYSAAYAATLEIVYTEPEAITPQSATETYATALAEQQALAASGSPSDAPLATVVAESVGWAVYQNARPDADVADGGWLNEAASNTDLHLSVGEGIPNLATYIRSSTDPVNDTCTFGLTDIANPADGEILIRVIARWVE